MKETKVFRYKFRGDNVIQEEIPVNLLTFRKAVKKPIPIDVVQMREPFAVETLEGRMNGSAGDYLIRGISGEMYPCDREIFNNSYDYVEGVKDE